jgi:hypothetical protein
VHTDDLAWHHSIFGWVDLLTDGILERVRRGVAVSFRPPAWEARDRPGAIEVPAGISTLIVEGVGVGRRELADVVDASVWVQSDLATMDQRNLIRVGNGELPMSVHEAWMAEELPFLAAHRPWERASLIVAGTPVLHLPRTSTWSALLVAILTRLRTLPSPAASPAATVPTTLATPRPVEPAPHRATSDGLSHPPGTITRQRTRHRPDRHNGRLMKDPG